MQAEPIQRKGWQPRLNDLLRGRIAKDALVGLKRRRTPTDATATA